MAINYDALPSDKPQNTVPKGYYKATITKAEMKTSKNTGAVYLSLQYDIDNGAGVKGKLFDMQFDSEKEFLRYKLQRFLTALKLNLTGSFELKDLCKIVNGKQFVVDVTVEDTDKGPRNTVNSFEHEIYYSINEWASLTSAQATGLDAVEDNEVPTPGDADAPAINAADALDSTAESY